MNNGMSTHHEKDQSLTCRENDYLSPNLKISTFELIKYFCQKTELACCGTTCARGNSLEYYKMFHSCQSLSGMGFLELFFGNLLLRTTNVDKAKPKFRRKMEASNLYAVLFVFTWFCASMMAVSAYERDGSPPRVVASDPLKTVTYVGQTLTLPCSVSGVPSPLTVWWKDGLQIGSDWKRFKRQKEGLRIRKVELSDSGLYHCEAVNGFGTELVKVQLQVHEIIKKTRSSERKRETAKPIFSQPVKMRRHTITKPLGGTVSFKCKAKGKPKPKIRWYKEGNLTEIPNPSGPSKPHWVLTLRDIKSRDSGRYTCRVWNSVGEISFDYFLRVVGVSRHERPVLLKPHPLNTTVNTGGKASLQCRVRSVIPPTVKWIKCLDYETLNSFNGELPSNSVEINEKLYLILPPQEMIRLPDGSYLNKLVISHATEKDSGMYICLGANTMGYNFRYAYLTVNPVGENIPALTKELKENPLPLAVILGVPVGIGLVLVFVVTMYCLFKREQFGRFSGSSSKETGIPQNPNSAKPYYEEVSNPSSASSRSDDFTPTSSNQHRLNVHFVPDVASRKYSLSASVSPKYTVSDSLSSSDKIFSEQSESEATSNYVRSPPPPPPPSQYSCSSSTDAGNYYRSHHSCQMSSGTNHKHRKRARTNSSSFHTLCSVPHNFSDT